MLDIYNNNIYNNIQYKQLTVTVLLVFTLN